MNEAHLFATDSRDLGVIRDFHRDDVFVPLPLDTIETRLRRAGHVDVHVDVGDYEVRFTARKPPAA